MYYESHSICTKDYNHSASIQAYKETLMCWWSMLRPIKTPPFPLYLSGVTRNGLWGLASTTCLKLAVIERRQQAARCHH